MKNVCEQRNGKKNFTKSSSNPRSLLTIGVINFKAINSGGSVVAVQTCALGNSLAMRDESASGKCSLS